MDYYSTLGLTRGASEADIKKAYRSMAMKHHPDRGGDEKKFKEVEEAYRTLSDPQKKQMVDAGMDPNAQGGGGQNPFEFHFGSGNFEDMFNQFGFGFGQRPMRRNKSININVEITLEDVLNGKDLNAEIAVPGGRKKVVNISIPPGIENSQQIRYQGMGDNSIPDLRPGDLLVNVFVKHHPTFRREHDSLICEKQISVWDALLGGKIHIRSLDGRDLDVTIPAGTQPDSTLRILREGLPNMRSKQRGNILIRIKVVVPKNLSIEQQQLVEKLKNGV